MRSNKLFVGCGIAVIVVLVLSIAGLVLGNFLIPEVSQQIPPSSNQIFVNITQPVNGANLQVNQPLTIYVEAFNDKSIQGINLMVNGVQVPAGTSTPTGKQKLITSWTFTPDKEGTVTLLASASSGDGSESISNAVNFQVVPPDQVPIALVEGGLTAPEVITDETGLLQPGGGEEIPPPPGFDGQGAADNPPPFPEEGDQSVPEEPGGQPGNNLIPIKFSLWADMVASNLFGSQPPAAPKVDGGANQCEGILVVEDNSTNEIGFNLYRLEPGALFFSLAATLDGKTGKSTFSYHDPGLANGTYFYYLSSFNSTGETKSNIIAIKINDGQCINPVNQSLNFTNFKLTANTPVNKVYCYISTNGPWWRIPVDVNSFIQASNGVFDLNPYLGSIPAPKLPQTTVTINIQCWGWNGSTLVYLGASQQTWSPIEKLELSGSLFEIFGSSQGEQQWMKGDMPDTDVIAPPYDVFISKDPKYCKDHVPQGSNYNSQVSKCEGYVAAHKIMMFWTWNRYGNCNPGAEICDMKYKPKDGYKTYVLKNGKLDEGIPPLGGGDFRYAPVYPYTKNDEFFVTAYSKEFGESFDSNHVPFPFITNELVVTPTLETIKFEILNDGSGAQFSTYTSGKPDELITGFSYFCSNPGCTNPPYPEWRFIGNARFTLPEPVEIENAWLEWDTVKYVTDAAGANQVITNCGVNLEVQQEGTSTIEMLSSSSMWGIKKFEVTQPIKLALSNGKQTILFRFISPQKQAGPNWNRCLWYLKNVSLKIQYLTW